MHAWYEKLFGMTVVFYFETTKIFQPSQLQQIKVFDPTLSTPSGNDLTLP